MSCETCLEGKAKRRSFPERECHTKAVLEIIHSDVCSANEVAHDKSKYFITFLDDYSRYSEVAIMKKKSQALESFKNYMASVERFHEKKIKCLQSDNGGEYKDAEFVKLLESA